MPESVTMQPHPHYSPTPTFFKLWYVQNMSEMLLVKNREEFYILPAFMSVPPNLSGIRGVGLLKRLALIFWLINLHMQYTI